MSCSMKVRAHLECGSKIIGVKSLYSPSGKLALLLQLCGG